MAACALRAYEAEDAEALYAAVRESLAELSAWMPWCHADYAVAEAREWTASRRAAAAQGLEYDFAIVNPDGRLLGGCGINQVNRIHGFANLGYWVRTSVAGRGVARAAVGRLADWAFDNTDLARLEIVCALGNDRSQRAAVGAGAIREGILHDRLLVHGRRHDAVMFSITRGQWRGGDVAAAPSHGVS